MRSFLVFLLAMCSFLVKSQPKLSYNHGFEVPYHMKGNWRLYDINGKYAIGYTDSIKRSGNYSLLISGKDVQRTPDDNDGGFSRIVIAGDLLKGKKKAKIEAYAKTDRHTTHAAIWLNQYTKPSSTDPLNEDFTDSISDHNGWQHLTIEIPLRDSAFSTEFGALLNGPGKAWFDDFVLYLDDVKVEDVLMPAKTPTAAEIQWLNHNTIPVSSVKRTTENEDLKTLSRWIGDAKVIGVGEPTHGSSDAGLFKLRLFQYLVEHQGFNVFMVEDQVPESGKVNDYILGKTDTAAISDYLFKVAGTQETRDIIHWMWKYNASHSNKIQLAGMDMQSAKVALDNLKRFAALHDQGLTTAVDELIHHSEGINKNLYDTAGTAAHWPFIQQALAKLKTYTEDKVASYYTLLPKDTANWIVLNLTILKQFFSPDPQQRTMAYRDSCMAKNIFDFTRMYPQAKVLISAHNMHVAVGEGDSGKWMGRWLDEYLKNDYYKLAIAVGNGFYTAAQSFTNRVFKPFPLQKPYPGTAEYYFEKVNKERFLLSLHKSKDQDGAWLNHVIKFRGPGFVQQQVQFFDSNLREHYNGIVYFRNSTPTHLIPESKKE